MSRVFVALTTWEPPRELLERQLQSLSRQTFTDWTGVVVDDGSAAPRRAEIAALVAAEPRLRLVEGESRFGFYRNFERALQLAPSGCDYVALCDQDDHWRAGKLARQVAALDLVGAALCYSDVRLVDEQGVVLADTFWAQRAHGRSAREVLYNNVVTGATALFRRSLLELALPFPEDAGRAFHDHWLALCALCAGGLCYLHEPLVDYTQHGRNALGAQGHAHAGERSLSRLAIATLGEVLARPSDALARLDRIGTHATRVDARLRTFADALAARVSPLPHDVALALRPFASPTRTRIFDLLVPTLAGSLAAGQETNLEPLKIGLGLLWAAARRR